MKRLAIVLFLIAASVSCCFAQNVFVATPTSDVFSSTSNLGFGTSTNVVNVTASTTSLTNAFASLPSEDFDGVFVQAIGGTIYINGSTATNTLGVNLTTSMAPMYIPLPHLPKSRGKCYITGAGYTLRMIPIKLRQR